MSCNYNLNSRSFECTSCFSGYVLDTQRKQCRIECSNTQYFSWEVNSCISCPSGQYLNPNSKTCTSCPNNCATCGYNFDTKVVECQSCSSGSSLDSSRKLCRLNCASGTFYDWGSNSCKSCQQGTLLLPGSETC